MKTVPAVDLRLDFMKNGEKIYELMKSMASDLRPILTRNKYKMSQLFPDDYQTRTSFPTKDFVINELTVMAEMFKDCTSLTSLNLRLPGFDTSKIGDMINMFYNCKSLTFLNVSNFDTSNCRNMNSMFYNCQSLTSLEMSNFDTSNCYDMGSMFCGCSNLTEIIGVIDMKSCFNCLDMFVGCPKLAGVKIKNPPQNFYNGRTGLQPWQYEIVE